MGLKEQLVLAKDVMGLTIIDNLIIRRNNDLAPFLSFLLQPIAGEKAHKLLTEVHKCDIASEDASIVYYHRLSLSIVFVYHRLSLSIVSVYHGLYYPGVRHARIQLPWHSGARGDGAL